MLFRRSYGAGFLRRLRDGVGPFASLRLTTMDRSDSRIGVGAFFLSLNAPSRLAPAVGASGRFRASQVSVGSFFACHALRPRQVSGNLTSNGCLRVGFRRCDSVPTCMLNCFEAGWLKRRATAAYGLRSSLCTLPGGCSAGVTRGNTRLSFLPATLGIGRLVRPFHSVLSF